MPAPPIIQFAPPWRFVVTDRSSATRTFLDRISTKRSLLYTLDSPAHAVGTVDSANRDISIAHTDGDPYLAEGNRLLYGFRREGAFIAGDYKPWVCRFAGPILQIDDVGTPDIPQSTFTAFDPWMYLMNRPVCNAAGDFP